MRTLGKGYGYTLDTTPITEKADEVYFDPKTHSFRTVREEVTEEKEQVKVSSPAKFYRDAMTTLRTERISVRRVREDFEWVEDPAECPYAKKEEHTGNYRIADWGIVPPEPHEDLLKRVDPDGLPRPALNLTNMTDEGRRAAVRAALKTGATVYVLAQTDEDLRRVLDEYRALTQGRSTHGPEA